MSYMWGIIKTDKLSKSSGAIMIGFFITAFIGIPILLAAYHYELNIPVWVGILYIIIVFPLVTFLTYKAISKKSKK